MRTLIHLLRYRVGIDSAKTQTTDAERACVSQFAHQRRRAVEIGVYEGVTTGIIAAAIRPEGVLYAIDPFLAGRLGVCWGKAIARRESYRYRPKCRIEFVEDFSHNAAQKISGLFDFIFVDGDHSREGIARDWSDWSCRVGPGGIIALHDTLVPSHNPAVASLGSHHYFMEHIRHDPRFEIAATVDSLTVLRRIDAKNA